MPVQSAVQLNDAAVLIIRSACSTAREDDPAAAEVGVGEPGAAAVSAHLQLACGPRINLSAASTCRQVSACFR